MSKRCFFLSFSKCAVTLLYVSCLVFYAFYLIKHCTFYIPFHFTNSLAAASPVLILSPLF